MPDGPPPAALELYDLGVDILPGVVVVMPLELVIAQGALQIAEGVDIRLKGPEEKGQLKAPGREARLTAQQRPGQQRVGTLLQS